MLLKGIAVVAFAGAFGALPVSAQLIHNMSGPSESPPSSYKGDRFVDSRGCIFMRVGYGASTEWVPRVTRNRKVICGYKPTFVAGQAVPVRAGGGAMRITLAKPAPQPLPAPVAAAGNVGAPMMTIAGTKVVPRAPAPHPPTVTYAAPRVVMSPAPAPMQAASVRAPARVVRPNLPPPQVPKGYNDAWKDGRLNPRRGPRTAQGEGEMNLVWTRTVPRKLIDTRNATVVTKRFPWLSYPVTAHPPQATGTARVARLSTGNAPAAGTVVVRGRRYVQVGSFGVRANASRTAARLRAMGLPVATGHARVRGKQLQTVMAGPFASSERLTAALAVTHRAGFADAYIR